MRCKFGGTPQCKVKKWPRELEKLRNIVLECGLTEELKWSIPCYTYEKKNILIVSAFKEYCALSFFKGALLKDSAGILISQTDNAQAARQIRFTTPEKIDELEPLIKEYILEAVEIEKSGKKIKTQTVDELPVPQEFQDEIDRDKAFKAAFEALTPGRQKAYLLHFAAPKQSKTRSARIEKCIPLIFDGIGLNDR